MSMSNVSLLALNFDYGKTALGRYENVFIMQRVFSLAVAAR